MATENGGKKQEDKVSYKNSTSHERTASDRERPHPSTLKGRTSLLIAIGVVGILLIAFPAYRFFLAISVAIALVVAAILFFWHKLRPIRAEDVDDKRPLKLD